MTTELSAEALAKRRRTLGFEVGSAAQPVALTVCRRCTQRFDKYCRDANGCTFHPESWSGETKQRWAAPGDNVGGAEVHYFWSCCGKAEEDASGCKSSHHRTFDEEDGLKW